MALCLSAAEIGALAVQLGVPVAAGSSATQAAHQLVRGMDRGGQLGELRATLRQVRPLVEWPEPGRPSADDEALELSGEALVDDFAPAPAPFDALEAPAPPSSGRAPASFSQQPAQAPSPFELPAGAPALGAPSSARPASSAASSVGANPWQPRPRQAPRALDARILIAVAGLMVVAAGIAFAAGRVSSGDATATLPPNPAATATGAPRRPDGPAVRAADAMGRSLSNVSRACELRGIAPGEVLVAALADCGPGGVARRPRRPPPDPDAAPAPPEPAPVNAAPPRAADPSAAAIPGGPCLADCDSRHGGCRSGCGAEPQHATEYAPHQQCLAKCLAAASKCRLGCE